MRNLLILPLAICCLLATATLSAQIEMPAPSPSAKLETKIGLTDVSVEYSRPQKRGRDLFSTDGLVPYGEVWRTGANQATKVTFGGDVMVAGNEVPAGSYAVLTKPMADKWEVMFFPYQSGSWNSYVDQTPALTYSADVMTMDPASEAFTIEVNNYTSEGAHLTMAWGKTAVAVPVTTNSKEQVMASIERVMAGPSANDYFNAATFMAEDGGDAKKGLEYIRKANSLTSDKPRYWYLRREAAILSQLGMKQEAVEVAKKSLALAKEAGNMDYVRLNEAIIEENMK